MKIAIVRGDFAASSEISNFLPLSAKNEVTLITGLFPVWSLPTVTGITIKKLPSPVDLNFGHITRWKMAILNRVFVDAHVLFGLENELMGYDIVHAAETYYSYTRQSLKAKKNGYVKKVVSTVWENIPFNNEGILGRKAIKKYAIENIDLLLPVTQRAKQVLILEGCNPDKIEVLKPGVNIKQIKRTPGGYGKIQKNKNIKLIFSGRLIPEKGILELIDMFLSMANYVPNIEFIIAGDGPLMPIVMNKASLRPGQIYVLGNVAYQNMIKVYSACDVMVHYPVGSDTWIEQYGMALIEAMACGLPVVGLDRGSVKEIVGNGGIVVSEKFFPKSLLELLKSKTKIKELSRTAVLLVMNDYNSEKYALRLEGLYKTLLMR